MSRSIIPALLLAIPLAVVGCAGPGAPPALDHADYGGDNPIIIAGGHPETIWNRTVEVINDYHFEIAHENQLDGVIETHYKTGANLFELWHPDAQGLHDRLEGTLQSIRRRVIVTVRPTGDGGWIVAVQVLKEIEDLDGLAANSPGGATFQESNPLDRQLSEVIGQSSPSNWTLVGRDTALEQHMLGHIRTALSR